MAREGLKTSTSNIMNHNGGKGGIEGVEGSNEGGCSWYGKLHYYLRVRFSKKATQFSVSNKNLNWVIMACLTVNSFLRFLFGESQQLCL